MAISRKKEARSRDHALLLSTSRVHYSAQYDRQHYTLQAFVQFGALYIHNLDDKYPTRPRFEPSTSECRATAGTNERSRPAVILINPLTAGAAYIRVFICIST